MGNYVLRELNKNGYLAYLVGGCVRDGILKIPSLDIDITTNATPAEVKGLFPKTLDTGIKYGTVTVIDELEKFEITTFRCDGDYINNRHPENVFFSDSLVEDLKRRDFTINAIAMDVDGNIIDPFHGQADIKMGIIRCVGDANLRFSEDALRILRGVKFACRFHFSIEEKTYIAMKNTAFLLANISAERILKEIAAAFATNARAAYSLLLELDFFQIIANGALQSYFVENEQVINCQNINEVFGLFLDENSCSTLAQLSFSKVNIKKVKQYIYIRVISSFSTIDIKYLLNKFGESVLKELIEFKIRVQGENLIFVIKEIDRIIDNNECYLLADLAISGKDLYHIKKLNRAEYLKNALNIVIHAPDKNKKKFVL